MMPIVEEKSTDLVGWRYLYKWFERYGPHKDDLCPQWAEWDSVNHYVRGDIAKSGVATIEDARRIVAERSHGLVVAQVAHDRWEVVS